MTDINKPTSDEAAEDPWAAAMQEQADSTSVDQSDLAQNVEPVFKPLTSPVVNQTPESRPLDMIKDIPLTMSAILGKTKMTIKELLELSQGSVVQLDGMAGSPLHILINNYLVASGEVVVVNEHYGIRITEIMTPSERMQNLAR